MKGFKVFALLALSAVTTTAALSSPRPGSTKTISLRCLNRSGGFQIEVLNGQAKTPLLGVKNTSGIRQKCDQVAARLKKAIDSGGVEKLMIVADSIGRQEALCVVRSVREGCNQDNLLIDVPKGRDRDEFLDEVLKINTLDTQKVFSGSEGQNTRQRAYRPINNALRKTK
ncbi:MAG: COP23 domain-containing protein [Leptolyngbya sp. BL-A-14]